MEQPKPDETNVLVLIKKIQQQLTFLEGKIDTLIHQSGKKTFTEKPFSKFPPRSFDRPYRPGHHHGKASHGDEPRKASGEPGRYSEKRRGDEDRGFGGKKRGFEPKKKFSFHKRKER